MDWFLYSIILLILGYFVYGYIVEKIFGADKNRHTPAIKYADGVDFVKLPLWKIFLIQFLNIAGLGPIFGAVLGAAYGPVCLLWIVFGSIFAGGVHDYLTGMFSVRFKGKTLNFLIEKTISNKIKFLFCLFLVLILILAGTVFAINPAKMLSNIFDINYIYFAIIIFIYYFLSTLLPIDKIIGKIYPIFAILLLVVTVALLFQIFNIDHRLFAEKTFENLHPKNYPIFPLMFITIACGALSGFHATQSPIMARCLKNEKDGRKIFYGTMILEGIIALIWATITISFYQDQSALGNVLFNAEKGQGVAIQEVTKGLLGKAGSLFAIFSVIILSITSGDTAYRAARLTLEEYFNSNKKDKKIKFILSCLILCIGIIFASFNTNKLWYYFGWANQTFATLSLWAISIYLKKKKKFYIISLVPAIFMTIVCLTYLFWDKQCLGLDMNLSKILSVIITIIFLIIFLIKNYKKKRKYT